MTIFIDPTFDPTGFLLIFGQTAMAVFDPTQLWKANSLSGQMQCVEG